jgi:hypothetical protein
MLSDEKLWMCRFGDLVRWGFGDGSGLGMMARVFRECSENPHPLSKPKSEAIPKSPNPHLTQSPSKLDFPHEGEFETAGLGDGGEHYAVVHHPASSGGEKTCLAEFAIGLCEVEFDGAGDLPAGIVA